MSGSPGLVTSHLCMEMPSASTELSTAGGQLCGDRVVQPPPASGHGEVTLCTQLWTTLCTDVDVSRVARSRGAALRRWWLSRHPATCASAGRGRDDDQPARSRQVTSSDD